MVDGTGKSTAGKTFALHVADQCLVPSTTQFSLESPAVIMKHNQEEALSSVGCGPKTNKQKKLKKENLLSRIHNNVNTTIV